MRLNTENARINKVHAKNYILKFLPDIVVLPGSGFRLYTVSEISK